MSIHRLSDQCLVSVRGGWVVTVQRRRLCTDRLFKAICDLSLQPTGSRRGDKKRYSRSNGSDILTQPCNDLGSNV